MAKGSEFKSQYGQEFSLLHAGAYPASYPMGIKGYFPRGKMARA
jgi:hypothetical protein